MLVMFVSCLLVNFGRLKEQLHSHCGGGVVVWFMLVMFVFCLLVTFGRLKEQLHSHCGGV